MNIDASVTEDNQDVAELFGKYCKKDGHSFLIHKEMTFDGFVKAIAEHESNRLEKLVIPKIMEIIDEEIKNDIKMNEIFDTDAWWWHRRTNEKFESKITRTLERVKEKIANNFSA